MEKITPNDSDYLPQPATGDTAPKGKYYCESCGEIYEHPGGKEPLPPCPSCKIWTLYTTRK